MSRFWPLASTPGGATDGSNFTLGNAGHATLPGQITHLWFYRSNTGASGIPVNIKLWDHATATLLENVDPSGASAGAGWKSFELPTPRDIDADQIFVVSAYWPGGRTFTRVAGGSRPTPETPLVWETNFARSNFGSDAYPATAGTATCEGVDVTFEPTDVPDPGDPTTNFSIENALARWLSSNEDNTRQEHLPWITKVAVDDVQTDVDTILANLATLGLEVLKTDSEIIEAIEAKLDTVDGIVTGILGPSGTLFTGLLRTYLDGLQADIAAVQEYARQANGGAQAVAHISAPGWTLIDSGTFDGDFEVTVRCDRIYVTVDETVGPQEYDLLLGQKYLTRYYWWHPVFDGVAGQYATQRAQDAMLYVPGMRMDGARVFMGTGRAGAWGAWRFDG